MADNAGIQSFVYSNKEDFSLERSYLRIVKCGYFDIGIVDY